jgi:hypothetical protein
MQLSGQSTSLERKFKVCTSPADYTSVTNSFLTGIPCGTCPVLSICSEEGIISPQNCEYYKQWLEYAVEGENSTEEANTKMDW